MGKVLLIGGSPMVGKSTVAKRISAQYELQCISTDDIGEILQGVGRKIIETLEQDEYFLRAHRIEIPASITGTEFYRKLGYDYKNGVKELENGVMYRLEKFRKR